jgi:hypothetical protein
MYKKRPQPGESGTTQPAIAEAIGVSLSMLSRAHMAYDRGEIKPTSPKRRSQMGEHDAGGGKDVVGVGSTGDPATIDKLKRRFERGHWCRSTIAA